MKYCLFSNKLKNRIQILDVLNIFGYFLIGFALLSLIVPGHLSGLDNVFGESTRVHENFYIEPTSLIELEIPGTFLFGFEGCTGDESINANDISIVSDKETVLLTKYVGEDREIPSGICNNLEIQIQADDPNSIKIVVSSLDLEIPANPDEHEIGVEHTAISIPSDSVITDEDLSHKSIPLDEESMEECKMIYEDFQKLDEDDFNSKYLYHEFTGDCVLLFEDSIWDSTLNIEEINQRLSSLKQNEVSMVDEDFEHFSITLLSVNATSENLYLYSFEGCTGDEFVNVENAVAASDTEVLEIVHEEWEGNLVPPGICRVFDIKIRADDPESVKIVLPMMNDDMVEQHDESEKTIQSPKDQLQAGIESAKVICREGFELLLKASNASPSCIKETHIEKLIERGWGKHA